VAEPLLSGDPTPDTEAAWTTPEQGLDPTRGKEYIDAATKVMQQQAMGWEIIQLRRQRMPWREIARSLGISQATAVDQYRRAMTATPVLQFDDYRFEETELIDAAINDLMTIAQSGRAEDRIKAWQEIRGWSERKAKLLGLDAPSRQVNFTLDYIAAQVYQLEQELGIEHGGTIDAEVIASQSSGGEAWPVAAIEGTAASEAGPRRPFAPVDDLPISDRPDWVDSASAE
jgi:hypothetical protein